MPFTTLDLIALAWFIAAWTGYAAHIEFIPKKKKSLNQVINQYRLIWMQRMLHREARMVEQSRELRTALPALDRADRAWVAGLARQESAIEKLVAPAGG